MGLNGAPPDAIKPWVARGNGEKAKIGIVLVHGFTSTPSVMQPWARFLNDQGYTVRVPLLPGHGSSIADLGQVTWRQWPREVEENLIVLSEQCEKVFLCGFSMGGAASLHVASQYQSKISGLILVNPMIHRKGAWPSAVRFASMLVKSFGTSGSDIKRKEVIQWKYDRTPMRAAHQLLLLLENTRPLLAKIESPLLLFRSEIDHTLPASNSAIIFKGIRSLNKTEVILKNSFHVAPLDHDQDVLFNTTLKFIEEVCADLGSL
jgi:carboxylesterase